MTHTENLAKKRTSGLVPVLLLSLVLSVNLQAQPYDRLNNLEGYLTKTYYSNGSKENAEEMAGRCDNVLSFYSNIIDFEPTVTLLVLSKADWKEFTGFPFYGMPHYSGSKLIVASEDNDFWESFIPPLDKLPGELTREVMETYSDTTGTLSMRGFFDLLVIHELGHIYQRQGGLTMQRRWMEELFSNILLHTYIAEKEPDLLPVLTVFPGMVVSSTNRESLTYTTLNELESNYETIVTQYPNTYGWYQSRWHIAAGNIYDEGKIAAFKNLWFALKEQKQMLDDPSLAQMLADRVHMSLAKFQVSWDE